MKEGINKKNETVRPPIVVILGHVDHGKTTILDTIRKSRVVAKEAGGITQHIGAYQIESNGKLITFLDTPGHEAFTAIRSRGANVADIAVLVVAAEEGVKPQTKEAIRIIKESKTPYIVAINKIDKDGANPQKVRQELAENDVMVEDYGGSVPIVEVSGKTGAGIDHLLELILLLADVEEIEAKAEGLSSGFVIESHMDSKKGVVATLIVQSGILNVGDFVSAGNAIAKVKSLEDFAGKSIKSAFPSQPCVVLGWEAIPALGSEFFAENSHEDAVKKSAEKTDLAPNSLFSRENISTPKTANLIIKADVQSSLEAIDFTLKTIKSDEVSYHVVDYSVGKISDGDVKKARSTNSSVIGFHVGIEGSAIKAAEREHVNIKTFDIIYELVEAVREIMSEYLDPEIKINQFGKLKVLAVFGTQGKTQIIGGKITQGKAVRGAFAEISRNGKILTKCKIVQLQQKKADVSEVAEGLECGLRVDVNPSALGVPVMVKENDILEIYEEQKIKRTLS